MPQPEPESTPQDPTKFYLTTPIYYVNARPHIGHAYTTVVADVLARRHRLLGHDTFFLTGTDEHGQKIERSAAAAGIPPQQFADQVSQSFRDLWDRMGLTYDRYIRTTSDPHKLGAQALFAELFRLGHIYLSSYTGSYCVSDEAFVDLPPGTPCPDCGRPLETVTEENFFFRLSAFQLPLLNLIESNTLRITPEASRNEVLSFLRGNITPIVLEDEDPFDVAPYSPSGISQSKLAQARASGQIKTTAAGFDYLPGALKDLSISRSSFTWGIPVPQPAASLTKEPHVIYVWLDALANYMTAIGYGNPDPAAQTEFKKWWPADLHLVGKEITRFHCVYWPAFLLALNPATSPTAQPATTHTAVATLRDTASAEPSHPATNLASAAEGSPVITWATPQAEISPEEHGLPPEPNSEDTQNLTPANHVAWAAQWLPKQITANGWLLFDNSKMSKSKGNVVRTETILDAFGQHVYSKQFPDSTKHDQDLFAADVLRYYLLREIPFGQDGSFSFEALVTRYNADLANGYGNLVSRTLKLVEQNFPEGWIIPEKPWLYPKMIEDADSKDEATASSAVLFDLSLDLLEINNEVWWPKNSFEGVLTQVMSHIGSVDAYLTSHKPWALAKSSEPLARRRLAEVLYTAAEAIRFITAALHPILPHATASVWAQLGLGSIEAAAKNGDLRDLQWGGLQPGTKLGPLGPIFPRADKSLIQTMTDMENQTTIPSALTDELAGTTTPAPTRSFDPAAGPRTLSPENPGTTVAGSHATTTERPPTPSHADTPGSGIFAVAPIPASHPGTPSLLHGEVGSNVPDQSPEIAIDDFAKIDLRVAQILVCERIPKADKLLRLEVDLGPLGRRQILSGIAEHYTPESLIGRRIIVITNLAPRKMRGLESHGMLLAANGPELDGKPGKPILATTAEDTPLGSRLR